MYLKPHCFRHVNSAAAARLTTSDIKVPWVRIEAEDDNSGVMFIGDSQVSATNAIQLMFPTTGAANIQTQGFLELDAAHYGMADALISLKDIWVLAASSGDGVMVMYLERVE